MPPLRLTDFTDYEVIVLKNVSPYNSAGRAVVLVPRGGAAEDLKKLTELLQERRPLTREDWLAFVAEVRDSLRLPALPFAEEEGVFLASR